MYHRPSSSKGNTHRRKQSYLLTLALLAIFSVSALTPLRRAAAQATTPAAGSEQTPIDIRDEEVTYDENLPALGFSYGTKENLTVINTGSPGEFATVRAVLPDESTSELVVADGSNVHYDLKQFHWHTPSEHELNGQKFPMEMHLVHQSADGTYSVVGVFIKSGKENKELAKIFADLPAQTNEQRAVARLNLTKLLPRNLESFRYMGSLTTPDFREGVRWIVLAEPIEMSSEQIAAFTALFPEGNSREVQPLNGRTILTDVETDEDNNN
jgi:carbonic anhydrase